MNSHFSIWRIRDKSLIRLHWIEKGRKDPSKGSHFVLFFAYLLLQWFILFRYNPGKIYYIGIDWLANLSMTTTTSDLKGKDRVDQRKITRVYQHALHLCSMSFPLNQKKKNFYSTGSFIVYVLRSWKFWLSNIVSDLEGAQEQEDLIFHWDDYWRPLCNRDQLWITKRKQFGKNYFKAMRSKLRARKWTCED